MVLISVLVYAATQYNAHLPKQSMTDFKQLTKELADDLEAWFEFFQRAVKVKLIDDDLIDELEILQTSRLLKRAYRSLAEAQKNDGAGSH